MAGPFPEEFGRVNLSRFPNLPFWTSAHLRGTPSARSNITMRTTRAAKVVMLMAAMLMMASLAVVSGFTHEEDDPPATAPSGPAGPRRDAAVNMPANLIGLEITVGLKDTRRSEWVGELRLSEGKVVSLEVVRGGADFRVEGSRFQVETAKVKKAAAKKKKAQQAAVPAVVRAVIDAPRDAKVTLHTGQGDATFEPASLKPLQPLALLGGEASVELQDGAVRLTGRGTEDDFPSAARAADGSVWMAYVEYHPEKARMSDPVNKEEFDSLVPSRHGDTIRLRRYSGKTWHPAIDVTPPGRDVWRPAVAVDGQGVVWVAWSEQIDGDWEIYRRGFTPPANGTGEGRWGETVRVTRASGSDFHVVATTDSKGAVWLAWQAFRKDNYEILATSFRGQDATEPRVVSSSPANDWSPALAADSSGGVFVAWDTYDQGNYDVMLRDVGRGTPARSVAASARFEGRPSVVCDRADRVWVAYEEGDEQWGKDYAHDGNVNNVGQEKNPGFALYVHRTLKVKCLENGEWRVSESGAEPKFPRIAGRNRSVPRLGLDGDGGLWLFFRHHPTAQGGGEVWVGSGSHFQGDRWSPLRSLTSSENLIDNRPALVGVDGGLLVVYSTDRRPNAQNRVEDDLYAAIFKPAAKPVELKLVAAEADPPATLQTVHPNEAEDIARMRSYRVDLDGKTLRPLRGEFHRHTEVSSHRDQDGLLEDSWRYALDAVSHDWMGNGDHDNGFGFEYLWWIIQKNADLHNNPPRFVGAQTYERSVVYPNGHRNVMMPRRGIRPLPRGSMDGTEETGTPDTKLLYAYLKHFQGICASHTSGTNMGTDWRDNDPEVEPVVEIYQGHRHNYEHFGAPRSPTEQTQIGGYQPKGFIWNALEKGYKLGFQSSSDHVSTHWSYAVVFAEDTSREAIIDAFKKRHCYAATDNILLDVRSGKHFMGDTFTTNEPPTLQIHVKGTAPLTKLHVIRNNKYVFSMEPQGRDARLTYRDDDAKPGDSAYYYVRIEQADKNLAWGSPMWIRYAQ